MEGFFKSFHIQFCSASINLLNQDAYVIETVVMIKSENILSNFCTEIAKSAEISLSILDIT